MAAGCVVLASDTAASPRGPEPRPERAARRPRRSRVAGPPGPGRARRPGRAPAPRRGRGRAGPVAGTPRTSACPGSPSGSRRWPPRGGGADGHARPLPPRRLPRPVRPARPGADASATAGGAASWCRASRAARRPRPRCSRSSRCTSFRSRPSTGRATGFPGPRSSACTSSSARRSTRPCKARPDLRPDLVVAHGGRGAPTLFLQRRARLPDHQLLRILLRDQPSRHLVPDRPAAGRAGPVLSRAASTRRPWRAWSTATPATRPRSGRSSRSRRGSTPRSRSISTASTPSSTAPARLPRRIGEVVDSRGDEGRHVRLPRPGVDPRLRPVHEGRRPDRPACARTCSSSWSAARRSTTAGTSCTPARRASSSGCSSQGSYDLSRFLFLGRILPEHLADILRLSDLHIYLSAPFVRLLVALQRHGHRHPRARLRRPPGARDRRTWRQRPDRASLRRRPPDRHRPAGPRRPGRLRPPRPRRPPDHRGEVQHRELHPAASRTSSSGWRRHPLQSNCIPENTDSADYPEYAGFAEFPGGRGSRRAVLYCASPVPRGSQTPSPCPTGGPPNANPPPVLGKLASFAEPIPRHASQKSLSSVNLRQIPLASFGHFLSRSGFPA